VPVDVLPLVGFVPLHPPEAVQPVAFVEFQARMAALPVPMIVGLAVSVTVGIGAVDVTVTVVVAVADPPAPVQASA